MKNKKIIRFYFLFLSLIFVTSVVGIGCGSDGGGGSTGNPCVWNNTNWDECDWQ